MPGAALFAEYGPGSVHDEGGGAEVVAGEVLRTPTPALPRAAASGSLWRGRETAGANAHLPEGWIALLAEHGPGSVHHQ